MCHLSVLCCPSHNSTHNQPTINPQSTHKQTRPCARSHALLPAWCFRLGFFSSRISNPQKAKAKTPNTLTPPARSGLLIPPQPFGMFGGVGGVNTNGGAIGVVSSRGIVSFLPQTHPSRLSFSWHRCAGCWRRQRKQHQRCANSPQRRIIVVLVASWLRFSPLFRGCVLLLSLLFVASI